MGTLSHGSMLLALCAFLPAACDREPAGRTDLPGEGFQRDGDVRVTAPANGDTVASPFVLAFTAGDDVSQVSLEADGAVVIAAKAVIRLDGELQVSLDDGRHRLALVGADGQGTELSRHELTVRVAGEDSSWVTIVSPADGAEVDNPVRFVVDASSDVDAISLFADDWEIGATQPGGMVSYEFEGTGYEREIQARAFDGDSLVATDQVSITVQEGTEPIDSDFNAVTMSLLEGYPTDGTHDYLWDGSYAGTTRDIYYLDTLVAEGRADQSCYCVGITWELYMRAYQQIEASSGGDGSLNEMDVSELYDFRTDWYVRDLWGAGAADAVELWGLGEEVTDLADLQPGDFVQFWRNSGSGHSVIFIDWETDGDGAITGMYYWSCQGSTDGLGYLSEYFGTGGSSIDPSYLFAARAWMPLDWLPW